MKIYPKAAKDLKIDGPGEDGKFTVIKAASSEVLTLTRTMTVMLSLCDGSHSVDDLATMFKSSDPSGSRKADVYRVMEVLADMGLLEIS
ncbi:MAG: hypothetical protein RDU20_17820 [Desulfomonilaceae bacterium]|nr:hypothetical protein [Desulfomonilaceae bacterium]